MMGVAGKVLVRTCLSAFLFVPALASAQDVSEDVASAYEAWDAAFNEGDAAAIAGFHSDDAVFLPPTHVVTNGPAGVEEFFAGLFEAGITGHELELIEAGGEDPVYAAANWSAEATAEDGTTQTIGGIATHVFERQDDGSLKLVLHTFN